MANNTLPKGHQVGDLIDFEGSNPVDVKMIQQIFPQGVLLRDPFTGQTDVKIHPFSRIKPYRTKTLLRQNGASGSSIIKKPKLDLAKYQEMTEAVKRVIEDPLALNPKQIIQLLRGKHYHFVWALTWNRLFEEANFNMAIDYYKLHRTLFLKYIKTVDFQFYDPKNIYANSIGALCSSYSEIIDATQMATGVSIDSIDFRRINLSYFKKQQFEQQTFQWLEGQFLPIFDEIKYSTFPPSLLIQLIIMLTKYFSKEKYVAEPWINVFQQLYRCLKQKLEFELPSEKDKLLFLKNMTHLFKLIFQNQNGYYLSKVNGDFVIEKIKSSTQSSAEKKIQQSVAVSEIPVKKIDRDQRVQIEEIVIRGMLARAYIMRGNKENCFTELNFCMSEINKEAKVRQQLLFRQQNWPVISRMFFQFIKKSDILERILNIENFAGNIVHIRNVFVKIYSYIPKTVAMVCIKCNKTTIIKQFLNQKTQRDEFFSWFVKFLTEYKPQENQVKELNDMMKFLDNHLKSKSIENVQSYREILLRKQFQLAFSIQSRQFHVFDNLLLVEDDVKARILNEHVHNTILQKCQNLLEPFNQYILFKYVGKYQINEQVYDKILCPMLLKQKDSIIFNQRKNTILAVLHSAFKRIETNHNNYFNLLRKFIEYYVHPQHDKAQQVNSWSDKEVFPVSVQSFNRRILFKYASLEFCEEILPKLSKFFYDLDIKIYHILFCKINAEKQRFIIDPISQAEIKKIEQAPLFFEPIIESLFYLQKHEQGIQQNQIEKYFKLANGIVKDRMLEIFLNIILKFQCSSVEACALFKTCKTRIFQCPAKNETLDHRVKFVNLSMAEKFNNEYLVKYPDNNYRNVIYMEQKRIKFSFELKDFDTLRDIKCKLATRINKQPCEIVFYNYSQELVGEEIQRTIFRDAVVHFIKDKTQYRSLKLSMKIPEVYIGYKVIPLQSPIHHSIYLHAHELIQYLPKSRLILQGIDFLTEDWSEFDKNGEIGGFFQYSLNSLQLPEIFQNSSALLNIMIDYFLWKKDEKDLERFNMCNLLSVVDFIQKRDHIVTWLKIVYLLHASHTFKQSYRDKLLETIIFNDPEDLEKSRLDEEEVYDQLLQLVFSIMNEFPQGSLEYCFTSTRVGMLEDCDVAFQRFKKYWRQLYENSPFQLKVHILDSVEDRFRLNHENMAYLGQIIEDRIEDERLLLLYYKTQQRITRFFIEVNKIPPSTTYTQKLRCILLQNIRLFCEKGIVCNFIQSPEFVDFLLNNIYDYIHNMASKVYSLFSFLIKTERNLFKVRDFFLSQIDERQWKQKTVLVPTRKYRELRTKGYVGLINCQNTCYANSLFQQLFHIQPFTRELLAADWQKKNQEKQDMLFQLKKIFIHLKQDRDPYENRIFYSHAFKTYDGQPIQTSNQMDVDEFKNILFNSLENILPKNMFWDKLFGGSQENKIKCLNCQNVSTNQQKFDSIHLTIQNLSNLQQSLQEHNKQIILENQNAYSCEKCNKKVRAEKSSSYKKLPPYLICVLKRFQYRASYGFRVKLNNHFEFPMGEFEWSSGQRYRLKGIISHLGYPESGHYISYVNIHDQWFEFNDYRVREMTEEQVKQNSYGALRPHQKSTLSDKTAYLLFYEAVDHPIMKNSMEVQQSVLGVETELQKIQRQEILSHKETAFQNRYYFELVLNTCIQNPSSETFRWLYITLLQIQFKLRENNEKDVDFRIEQIMASLTLFVNNKDKCEFLWEEYIANRTFQCMSILLVPEYKNFVMKLMVDNCHGRSRLVEQCIDYCLSAIYLSKTDPSPFWVFLHQMAMKFQWIGQYLHQGRCIGRIIDSVMFWQLRSDVREELKRSSDIPFEKVRIEPSTPKQQIRYRKWALLIFLLQRFGNQLHEAEEQLINQSEVVHIQRIFQQARNIPTLHYISQYICWWIKKIGSQLNSRILFYIRDALISTKADYNIRHLYILKKIIEIDDDHKDIRNKHVVTIFVKVLNSYNTNTFCVDYNFEYLWLWFLKCTGANPTFRKKIQQSKNLFASLFDKTTNNNNFCRAQRTNSYAKSRNRLHRLPIPKFGEAAEFHNRKIAKTNAILQDAQYDFSEDQLPDTILVEQKLNPQDPFFKFNDITQNFESFQARWIYGDLIAYLHPNQKEKFPSSHFAFIGDERVTLEDIHLKMKEKPKIKPEEANGEEERTKTITIDLLDSSIESKKC